MWHELLMFQQLRNVREKIIFYLIRTRMSYIPESNTNKKLCLNRKIGMLFLPTKSREVKISEKRSRYAIIIIIQQLLIHYFKLFNVLGERKSNGYKYNEKYKFNHIYNLPGSVPVCDVQLHGWTLGADDKGVEIQTGRVEAEHP